VVVSQRYVHPTPEGLERAFEQLQDFKHCEINGSAGRDRQGGYKSGYSRENSGRGKIK
jgi:hypothetical protein